MAFDNIKLEKGLYTTSKGFSASLEEIDPSENYKGTELEGLDAFQRQLKRFDIKVTGNNSDTVSKFFQTYDSATLFPEYISRAVRQGIDENDSLSKMIATTTNIDALDYRAIETNFSDEDTMLMDVNEGAFIPETVIKTKDKLTALKKRGRMIVASYEAIKYQRLDLFTIMLKKIGDSISQNLLVDAITELVYNGIKNIDVSTSGSIVYGDIVNLWTSVLPYQLNTLICSTSSLSKILSMPEFRDSNAGLNFHATGSLVTPLGAEIVRFGDADNTDGDFILGIDNRYALEMVQAGGVTTDYDKIIDRQLERTVISSTVGFSSICSDCAALLN